MKKTLISLSLAFASLGSSAADYRMQVLGSVIKLTYSDCQTYADAGYCTSWSFANVSRSDFVNGAEIGIGESYSFSFTFNQDAPLSAITPDSFQAIYFNAISGQHFNAGGIALPGTGLPQANIGAISVVNGRSGTDYLLYQTVFGGMPDFSASLNLGFQDRTGIAVGSFSIPLSLNLGSFTETGISIGFIRNSDKDQMTFEGNITSVTISAVPEPAATILLLLGLALFGLLRARQIWTVSTPAKIAA